MRRIHLTIITFLIISILGIPAHAFDITLAWDPNIEPDIIGYNLYSRENNSIAYNQIDYFSLDGIDPNDPQCIITDMVAGITYQFVVTAVNNAGLESRFSNEISVLNGRAYVTVSSGSGGGGGGGCFMSTSILHFQNQ